jgi:predicted nucleotide-binding protein
MHDRCRSGAKPLGWHDFGRILRQFDRTRETTMSRLPVRPGSAASEKAPAYATSIVEQIQRGQELVQRLERGGEEAADEYSRWRDCNKRLLELVLAANKESEQQLRTIYRRLCQRRRPHGSEFADELKAEMREIESVAGQLGLADAVAASEPSAGRKVLVVYGRNEEVKEKVARFLMQLGLEPILLDEQAAQGRTLIEKLEAHSSVAFAVVLLTGDDVGALASEPRALRPRARQNVVLELGFSAAKLTRERVCALYEEGVELPSDFRGVEYKLLDPAGAWKSKLAKELHEAGLRFDPIKVL